MTIRRLGYALGAEVTGLDLKRPLDDDAAARLRAAWLEHIVLCFPGQDLEPGEQLAFCARFGELDDPMNVGALPGRPDFPFLQLIVNQPVTVQGQVLRSSFASEWHSDTSYSDEPATGSFLLAKALPDAGGDTMFANAYLAYETLSPAMQRLVDGLEGVHDTTLQGDFARQNPEVQAAKRKRHPPVVHRVVRIHPETGRKALYVGNRLRFFVGMTEEETRPLRDFLNAHMTRYEFVYRHRWTVNDLLMWDNRCSMHYAVQDYDRSQLRRLQRCSLRPPKTGYLYAGSGA